MYSNITVPEELLRFSREYAKERYSFMLLEFFAEHPCAQFNELAVVHAVDQDGRKSSLRKALAGLINRGIIKTCPDNGIVRYSLTENMRSLVSGLANLDFWQRRQLMSQTCTPG